MIWLFWSTLVLSGHGYGAAHSQGYAGELAKYEAASQTRMHARRRDVALRSVGERVLRKDGTMNPLLTAPGPPAPDVRSTV